MANFWVSPHVTNLALPTRHVNSSEMHGAQGYIQAQFEYEYDSMMAPKLLRCKAEKNIQYFHKAVLFHKAFFLHKGR